MIKPETKLIIFCHQKNLEIPSLIAKPIDKQTRHIDNTDHILLVTAWRLILKTCKKPIVKLKKDYRI